MKQKTRFVCQECGSISIKWQGRCPECQNWNTFVEEAEVSHNKANKNVKRYAEKLKDITISNNIRLTTGIEEFDRVLGGGLVKGSLVLIGGVPGIGKSTLILEASNMISGKFGKVLYVSAEESPVQIKLRADRLKINSEELYLLSETDIDSIKSVIKEIDPVLVVLDSVQTIYKSSFESSAGTISQVREIAREAMEFAKENNVTVILVGHVTKDGILAGPRFLEHMVDAVLYFEGENFQAFRILKTVKNRFGATNEVGVFEMTQSGLKEIQNASEFFLSQRVKDSSGSVIVPVVEGTRSMLVELQALVSKTNFGIPSRKSSGVDSNRLSLIIAVLEKRAGVFLGNSDIFVNVAGGISVDDLSLDLAVAVSIYSGVKNISIDNDIIVLGELGLGGEVRAIPNFDMRIKEAKRMGFNKALVPEGNINKESEKTGIRLIGVNNIKSALGWFKTDD